MKNILLTNFDKIHTTPMGIDRIRKNLNLDSNVDVVEYIKDRIKEDNSTVTKKGKNYYIEFDEAIITINSSSFTIITAHSKK